MLHGRSPEDPVLSGHEWVLELDAIDTVAGDSLEDDAWAIAVEGNAPRRVSIGATTERARLSAMYHIAKCLETAKPPQEWAIRRTPLVPKRYAWVSAGRTNFPAFRPDWFDHAVGELPGMGFNGVVLTCNNTHGTSAGRQTIPVQLTEDGVVVDRFKLPAYLQLFEGLESYGLDICLFHQAFVPPGFDVEAVREHYAGKRELPGLEDAIRKNSREMASAIFKHMPQVDSLFHHSLECPWMWEGAVSIFPCDDHEAGERAFDAYLTALTGACEEHGKELLFWTHVSNIPARQIRLMHRVLERHPSVVVIEDHAWPNDTWPHTPIMGHVPGDVFETVTAGRWGMTIVTTDGEFYGAGALPTAYPEPHVRSAEVTVKRGAECGIVRLNQQAMTPLSTLQDVNAISVIAASEQWWEPARSLEELWGDWCSARFGERAASAVVSALKKSETIIVRGLSASGLTLMDHSGLSVPAWGPGSSKFKSRLFDRPGELLLDKPYEDLEDGEDFKAWLVRARGMEFEEFLSANDEAQAAAREALREIESVREHLAEGDLRYLTRCFEDALLMMESLRRITIGLQAASRCSPEAGEAERRELDAACASLEEMADRIEAERDVDFFKTKFFFKARYKGRMYEGYGAPIALRQLADMYRKYGRKKTPNTDDCPAGVDQSRASKVPEGRSGKAGEAGATPHAPSVPPSLQ
jgi:hypothetical protein